MRRKRKVCKRKVSHGSCRVVSRRKPKVHGGSLWSWIKKKASPWVRKKALPWLKKNKLISKGATSLGKMGVPWASDIGKVASALGYGLNRTGGSLNRTGRCRGRGHAYGKKTYRYRRRVKKY
jgi:hypothetical protein